jgi:hypothetical protein
MDPVWNDNTEYTVTNDYWVDNEFDANISFYSGPLRLYRDRYTLTIFDVTAGAIEPLFTWDALNNKFVLDYPHQRFFPIRDTQREFRVDFKD